MKQLLSQRADQIHLAAFLLMIVTPPLMYLAATRDYPGALLALLGVFVGANLLELALP